MAGAGKGIIELQQIGFVAEKHFENAVVTVQYLHSYDSQTMKISFADGVCSHLDHVLTASSASDATCLESLRLSFK